MLIYLYATNQHPRSNHLGEMSPKPKKGIFTLSHPCVAVSNWGSITRGGGRLVVAASCMIINFLLSNLLCLYFLSISQVLLSDREENFLQSSKYYFLNFQFRHFEQQGCYNIAKLTKKNSCQN